MHPFALVCSALLLIAPCHVALGKQHGIGPHIASSWPRLDLWDLVLHPFAESAYDVAQQSHGKHVLGAVDVVEKEGEFVIVADTPGMSNKDVKVSLD